MEAWVIKNEDDLYFYKFSRGEALFVYELFAAAIWNDKNDIEEFFDTALEKHFKDCRIIKLEIREVADE